MENRIRQIEKVDGVRMTWNVLPKSSVGGIRDTIPVACLYSPRIDCHRLPFEPSFCQNSFCRAVINPYTTVRNASWVCQFCKRINTIDGSGSQLELQNTTVEYTLLAPSTPLVYAILLDTCFFDEDGRKLAVDAIKKILERLREDSLISFITFGQAITLHNLEPGRVRVKHVFSGKLDYICANNSIFLDVESLKFGPVGAGMPTSVGSVDPRVARGLAFVKTKKDCANIIIDIIESITQDHQNLTNNNMRVKRCTGSAISFAARLLRGKASKALVLTQGPCSFGPGAISTLSLNDTPRSYNEILTKKFPFIERARKFYDELAKKLQNMTVDIMAATLCDIGLYEMKPLISTTGGMVYMAQDFNREIYMTDFLSDCVYSAFIKVQTTSNIRYAGKVGHGVDVTHGLRINSLYKNHNLTFLFDILNNKSGNERNKISEVEDLAYIQIRTQYLDGFNTILRVTTICRKIDDSKENVIQGFDQEAAMVLRCRMLFSRREPEYEKDIVRRIDRDLVRVIKSCSSYQYSHPPSVLIPESMKYLPKFFFFLRRSPLVMLESVSPDEGFYFRNIVERMRVTDSMSMIMPTLTSYKFNGEVTPVNLDIESLLPDTILLLDSFHDVVVWKGKYIAQWMKNKIYEKEEYRYIKEFVDLVENKAYQIASSRVPRSRLVVCEQDSSQERLLLAKVNPSVKELIFTDDIDFASFYQFLCKIVIDKD